MIMKLKMSTTDKFKKAIRENFFLICGLRSKEGRSETYKKGGRINFLIGGDIQQKGEVYNMRCTNLQHVRLKIGKR